MIVAQSSNQWQLEFGDATVIGWIITLSYLAAFWLCLRAAARAVALRGREIAGVRYGEGIVRLWLFASVAMLFLGVNKELDLQRLVLEIARKYAQEGGWYRERAPIQRAAVVIVLAAAAVLAVWILWALRRHFREIWPVAWGLLVVGAYVALRTSSHHDVDVLMRAGPIPLRDSMELMGIVPLAWSAWRFSRRPIPKRRG